MSVAPPELHPALAPLAFLLGTWRVGGAGHYPTIEPFAYVEEISFVHVGKPWLLYTQRTRHAVEDRPLHAETGYWRPVGDGVVEVVMAYPTGHVEIAEGTVRGPASRSSPHVGGADGQACRPVERGSRSMATSCTTRWRWPGSASRSPPHLEATLHRDELLDM